MKKIISILLLVSIVIVLASCTSDKPSNTDTQTTTAENTIPQNTTLIKYLDSEAANGRYTWDKFSENEQSQLKSMAKKENITLDVKDNKTMVLSDSSGLVVTYGCEWPKDNSLMKNFPIPNNSGIAYTYVQEDILCFVGLFMTYDDCKSYKENFAELGFTLQPTEDDLGEEYYYYAAANSSNTVACIVRENGIVMICVLPNSDS